MEILVYFITFVPVLMLPMITFDIYSGPQQLFIALLSAAGVVALGAMGHLSLTLPVLLTLALILYMAVNTLWTSVLDGARKEFALQLSLLSVFLIVVHLNQDVLTVNRILIVSYIAGLLNMLYAFGQVFGIDYLFPMRLILNPEDRRPIGMIGNMNFFSSYILALFWVGVYIGLFVEGGQGLGALGTVLSLFLLYKARCRGSWLGLIGSVYVLLLLLSLGEFISFAYFYGTLFIGIVGAFAVGCWLVLDWNRIYNYRIEDVNNPKWKGFSVNDPLATLRYRLCYWKIGWELFLDKVIQGHGLRSYRKLVYYKQSEINDREQDFLHPDRYVTPQPRECHNDWLEDLVELGLSGSLIRWTLIGLVFYMGITSLSGNPLMLFLLTSLAASSIYAFFFFGLRLPSTGMLFWLQAGLVVLIAKPISGVSVLFFSPWNWVIAFFLILIFAALIWETNIKTSIASYYFMRFQGARNDREKEHYCNQTIKWAPEETIYNTHMTIGYLHTAPQVAYKYAERMWSDYDGMTPGWVMHYNKGSAAARIGAWELAFRHYLVSHRLLPSFQPTINALNELDCKMPFPPKGEIVKVAREELKQQVLAIMEKLNVLRQNVQLQEQNLQLQMQNLVLQEAGRLNIPEGWQYVPELGQFLSPEEFQAFMQQKQQEANQQAQPVDVKES